MKGIDAAIADVDARKATAESVVELFVCTDDGLKALFDEVVCVRKRVEMTKTEGSIMLIGHKVSDQPVPLRNKMAVQKAKAKTIEGDCGCDRIMHPKVRKIMSEGMQFTK